MSDPDLQTFHPVQGKLTFDIKSAAVKEVYNMLEKHLLTGNSSRRTTIDEIGSGEVVWTGTKFLHPGSVTQAEHQFKPALATLPANYAAEFPELWRAWHVGRLTPMV